MTTCPRHPDTELIHEPGGPDQLTIHGRTYCPKCSDEFLAALDDLERKK